MVDAKSGTTRRQEYEQAAKKNRAFAKLLEGPPFPEAVAHIWEWWLRLHATRGGGMGPEPINDLQIMAWSHNSGHRPRPWEVDAVLAIDRVWLEAQAEAERHRRREG